MSISNLKVIHEWNISSTLLFHEVNRMTMDIKFFDSSVDRLTHLYALKFEFKRTLTKLIGCKWMPLNDLRFWKRKWQGQWTRERTIPARRWLHGSKSALTSVLLKADEGLRNRTIHFYNIFLLSHSRVHSVSLNIIPPKFLLVRRTKKIWFYWKLSLVGICFPSLRKV